LGTIFRAAGTFELPEFKVLQASSLNSRKQDACGTILNNAGQTTGAPKVEGFIFITFMVKCISVLFS